MIGIIKYIFFDIGYTLVNEYKVWIEYCKEQANTTQAQLLGVSANTLMEDIQKNLRFIQIAAKRKNNSVTKLQCLVR